MRKPDIYTEKDSHFADQPYKRLEINISANDPLAPLTEIDKLIQDHFPGIAREKIDFGFHWRTEGEGGRDFLMLVLQSFSLIAKSLD